MTLSALSSVQNNLFLYTLSVPERPWKLYVKIICYKVSYTTRICKTFWNFLLVVIHQFKEWVNVLENVINSETHGIQNTLFNTIRFDFCNKLTMAKFTKIMILSFLSWLKSDIKRINKKQLQTRVNISWNILKIYLYFNISMTG